MKLGYTGSKLKSKLEKDKNYVRLLKERKKHLKKIGVSGREQGKFVLLTDKDVEILRRCNKLKKTANKEDRVLIKLINSQLEEDWRRPLINQLKIIEKRGK